MLSNNDKLSTINSVRTRFAPSPTGYLHVGGIRTALFAWLAARQAGGQFILRLEDTDKKREVQGAEEHIIKSLRALGLDYDEGPDIGGPYGPYRQSQRLENYKTWAQKLIDSGRAYWDVSSPQQLDELRRAAAAAHRPFLFRNHRPPQAPDGDFFGRYPLRFKSEPKKYSWRDEVMGGLSAGEEVVDDFILIKSDGYPTYNFAHVIDDMEMKISHVIRGQEFLSSTPNYLNLYEALGIDKPLLATMPHILGPDGNKKLSKRDGAKDVLDYIRQGFPPEALVSFIATMGWNDGTEQEIFTVDELIEKFSLARVQRSGARFDEKRLEWTSGHFIRQMPPERLYEASKDFWPAEAEGCSDEYKHQVLALLAERLKFMDEIKNLSIFFFAEPAAKDVLALFENPSDKQLKKSDKSQLRQFLEAARQDLAASDFSEEDIAARLNGLLEKLQTKPGILFAAIRIAISGAPASPQLFGTLSVLGKEKSLARLDRAIELLA